MRKAVRTIAALIAAAAILNLFCAWYYNPADYLWDDARATDRIRRPNAITSRANEGFSICRIDENGYNNPSVPDRINILMMGTSHTEGFNVAPADNTSARLGALLPGRSVYNIGMSSHTLTVNLANLERALNRFEPTDYVIIETNYVIFWPEEIEDALNDTAGRLDPTETGLPDWLSDQPLVRALGRQVFNLQYGAEAGQDDVAAQSVGQQQYPPEAYQAYYTELCGLFARARKSADAHGVRVIICYNPMLILLPDGTAADDTDPAVRDAFAAACADSGVTFVDMSDRFIAAYQNEHILPHGFVNTAPEYGHLNKNGCGIVANALYEAICALEADG